jgi:hypothetical protein
MKTAIQFRSRLTLGGAILAQPATFLPVVSAWTADADGRDASERPNLLGFPLNSNFTRKKPTVARPLLKDPLQ